MDLEKIQSQLKSHIRQHQDLVQEMKKDPQNVEIPRKLESLQEEFASLKEKQRVVVQQLKQNIKPKPEGHSSDRKYPQPFPAHIMVPGFEATQRRNFTTEPSKNFQIESSMIKASTMNNVAVPRISPSLGMGFNVTRNSVSNVPINSMVVQKVAPGIRHPLTAQFASNVSRNNVVRMKSDPAPARPVFKKPAMVTTGMQTMPSLKVDTTRLKPILPRPETSKAKVSLGIQTSKPAGEVVKQEREKLNFLSTLGLITVSKCREINSQKQERKRRTSAIFSPYSSFQFFEPEPKKSASNLGIKRGRGRPPKNSDGSLKSPTISPVNGFKLPTGEILRNNKTSPRLSPSPSPPPPPKDEEHEDYCVVCNQSGEVLMCDTCILVYHLKCLTPPLTKVPSGMWMCPKCQETCKNKEPMEWPGTLAITHSYLKHRAVKDKEKEKLLSRNQELKLQELKLQKKVNELSNAIVSQIQRKTEVVESTRQTQEKLQRLKNFIDSVHSW